MPRSFEVSVEPQQADEIIRRVKGMTGVVGLARQPGASIVPEGDVVNIQTTNDAARDVIDVLTDLGVMRSSSIKTSSPRSIISGSHKKQLDKESNETFWEEIEYLIRNDTNTSQNYLVTMFLAGAISAVGLWTDTLHLIVASMVVASAFEPLTRISFGLIAGPRSLIPTGITSTLAGYTALALGGALSLLILRAIDPGAAPDLESRQWVRYWSQVPASGVVTAVFAAAAGTVIILGQRAVLTTGVMIALALIPSMAITGMALASGELALAAEGLVRWLVDASLVMLVSAIVLALKQVTIHRRRAYE